MNKDPQKEPQVPLIEPDLPFFVMREAFLATEDTSSVRNMHSAGLNAYGDFVIKSWCGELIIVPHHERARLAAYLLSPWVESDDPASIGWVSDADTRTALRAKMQRDRQKVDPAFRTETAPVAEPAAQKRRTGGKGVIAR